MSSIFSRSPYIIEIDETGQLSSKVELYIWTSGAQPSDPQYTLSKKIPASDRTSTLYDVSPYIREYYSFDSFTGLTNVYNEATPTGHYVNVRIVRSFTNSTGEQGIDSIAYKAFNGYGLYEDGSNPDKGNVLLAEDTYTYKKLGGSDVIAQQQNHAGIITVKTGTSDVMRYTDLVTGATFTQALSDNSMINLDRCYILHRERGNKVELLTGGSTVSWTAYFRPIEECKYTPVYIDYINAFGAWSRVFMYKTSKTSIKTTSKDFKLMNEPLNYDVLRGSKALFQVNGTETLKVNSGFVRESFFSQLKELMLSDRVLVNNRPASIKTSSLDMQTGLNDNTMSYGLDVEFNNDIINA